MFGLRPTLARKLNAHDCLRKREALPQSCLSPSISIGAFEVFPRHKFGPGPESDPWDGFWSRATYSIFRDSLTICPAGGR